MLLIKDISKTYSSKTVLKNLSCEFNEGEITAVVGSNGFGKTTLIRIIAGVIKPTSGICLYNSEEDWRNDSSILGYLPEERGLYREMTVEQQIRYFARLKGRTDDYINQQLDYWLSTLKISEYRNKKIKTLSKGLSQRVQIITTLLHNPKIVLLDEPFSGLDDESVEIVKSVLRKFKENNNIIIISIHSLGALNDLIDKTVYFNKNE